MLILWWVGHSYCLLLRGFSLVSSFLAASSNSNPSSRWVLRF